MTLTMEQTALVSASDYLSLSQWSWCAIRRPGTTRWYAVRGVLVGRDGRRKLYRLIYMHRQITGAGPHQQVDHINHNTLDNRRDNLRLIDCRGNQENRKKSDRQTSRFKGVDWHSIGKKWRSRIHDGELQSNGERRERHLGLFRSEEDAARAYDDAARSSFGDHACLNFPGPGEQSAIA